MSLEELFPNTNPQQVATEEPSNTATTETSPTEKKENVSSKFAALAEANKKAYNRQQQLKQLENSLKEKEEKYSKWEKTYEQAKINPVKFLEHNLGLTFDQIVDLHLKNPNVDFEKPKSETQLLEEKYAELQKRLDEKEKQENEIKLKQLESERASQISDTLDQIVNYVAKNIVNDENKYPYIFANSNEAAEIFKEEIIYRTEKYGKEPDEKMMRAIVDGIEDYYTKEAQKYIKVVKSSSNETTNSVINAIRQKRELSNSYASSPVKETSNDSDVSRHERMKNRLLNSEIGKSLFRK